MSAYLFKRFEFAFASNAVWTFGSHTCRCTVRTGRTTRGTQFTWFTGTKVQILTQWYPHSKLKWGSKEEAANAFSLWNLLVIWSVLWHGLVQQSKTAIALLHACCRWVSWAEPGSNSRGLRLARNAFEQRKAASLRPLSRCLPNERPHFLPNERPPQLLPSSAERVRSLSWCVGLVARPEICQKASTSVLVC